MTTPVQTFGATLGWGSTPTTVAHVQDITGPGETAESEDITNHQSPSAYREKVAVILDGGELTFDLVYINETGQAALRSAFEARTTDTVTLTLPNADTIEFPGFVSQWNWAVPVAGVLKASISITVAGAVTPTFA